MKQGCQGPWLFSSFCSVILDMLDFGSSIILVASWFQKGCFGPGLADCVRQEAREEREAKALSSSDLKVSSLRRDDPLGSLPFTLACRNWVTRQLGLRPVTGQRE